MDDTCNCVKEIEAIFKDWKSTVDTDSDMKRAFSLGIAMGESSMMDKEAVRIYKKKLLQPIIRWIMAHGGSIE